MEIKIINSSSINTNTVNYNTEKGSETDLCTGEYGSPSEFNQQAITTNIRATVAFQISFTAQQISDEINRIGDSSSGWVNLCSQTEDNPSESNKLFLQNVTAEMLDLYYEKNAVNGELDVTGSDQRSWITKYINVYQSAMGIAKENQTTMEELNNAFADNILTRSEIDELFAGTYQMHN